MCKKLTTVNKKWRKSFKTGCRGDKNSRRNVHMFFHYVILLAIPKYKQKNYHFKRKLKKMWLYSFKKKAEGEFDYTLQ